MKCAVDKSGCIKVIELSDGTKLTTLFGFNEYALVKGDLTKYDRSRHYGQHLSKRTKSNEFIGNVMTVENEEGHMEFTNVWEVGETLTLDVIRKYTKDIKVYDACVCFLVFQPGVLHTRMRSNSGIWFSSKDPPSHYQIIDEQYSDGEKTKTKNIGTSTVGNENLLSYADKFSYSEILGDTWGLRFEVESCNVNTPIQELVQPLNRKYVEYQLEFNRTGERKVNQMEKARIKISELSKK